MRTQVGLDHYTISHRGLTPGQTLEFARAHRFDGVQFLEPSAIDAELESGRLAAFRRYAEDMGLYLEIGLPSPSPVRRSRELDQPISAAEHARSLEPHLEAVAALGCRYARAYVGDRHDRFRSDVSWHAQLETTHDVLKRLTPRLLDLGIRMAIENHADFTVSELLDFIDRLDPRAYGVTLDTGNLLMRLDCPVQAAYRLAPHVVCTHIKDAVLAFTARGLCWQSRPVGSGILPLPDILAALIQNNPDLRLTIEHHPRIYDLPIFDRKWLGFFPGLSAESLAAIVQLATQCEERFAQGTLPRPEVVEAIPWANRDLDWLASSLGYLRSVVPTLARLP